MSQENLRIYAGANLGTGPIRPPRTSASITSTDARKGKHRVDNAAIISGEISRILDAMPASGESVQRAFDRKEQELRAVIASLTHSEAAALHLRLTSNRKDGVNASFVRLTVERRTRLLSLLAETPRGRVCAQ